MWWERNMYHSRSRLDHLDVEMVPLKSISRAMAPGQSTENRPLVHLYFLEGQDVDVQAYKDVIKPRLEKWVNKVKSKQDEEWLIVYIGKKDDQLQTAASRLFSINTTVFERVRADFQPKSDNDHVILLQEDDEGWVNFIRVLKNMIISSVESQFTTLYTYIRQLDSNRLVPGWNYCRFFILKESLINLYDMMNLYDEALKQYDELDAVFNQIMEAKKLSWFTKFGGTDPGDDNTDLLNLDKKNYRKDIIENKIMLFDFLIYLFGSQCRLILKMGQPLELSKRAKKFLTLMTKIIKDIDTGLSLAFISVWSFNTCMNIVDIIEGFPVSSLASGPSEIELSIRKAELLNHARYQLLIIGTLSGRLPRDYLDGMAIFNEIPFPFPVCLDEPSPNPDDPGGRDLVSAGKGFKFISSPLLSDTVSSDQAFDQVYEKILRQAASYSIECGRKRVANMLKADVARILMLRGKFSEAQSMLKPLIPRYNPKHWTPIYTEWLQCVAICEKGMGDFENYISSIHILLIASDAKSIYQKQFLEASKELRPPGAAFANSPLFIFKSIGSGQSVDSNSVKVVLYSHFRNDVAIDMIKAKLERSGQNPVLLFKENDVELKSGENTVILHCKNVTCTGFFKMKELEICIGNVKFIYYNANVGDSSIIRLDRNPSNISAEIFPIWPYDKQKHPDMSNLDGTIDLPAMEPGSQIVFRISLGTLLSVKVVNAYIEYNSGGDKCLFYDNFMVSFSLPFDVKFESVILQDREVVKLTLLPRSVLPIKISDPQIVSGEGYNANIVSDAQEIYVSDGVKWNHKIYFELISKNETQKTLKSMIPISFGYNPYAEEQLCKKVSNKINELATKYNIAYIKHFLERLALFHIKHTLTVSQNGAMLYVNFLPFDESIKKALKYESPASRKAAHKILDELYNEINGSEIAQDTKKTGSAVDVLHVGYKIEPVVATDVHMSAEPAERCYVGELVNIKLDLTPFTLWGANCPLYNDIVDNRELACLDLIVHVQADEKKCIIISPPKMTLRTKVGETATLKVGAIPQSAGEFPVPNVTCELLIPQPETKALCHVSNDTDTTKSTDDTNSPRSELHNTWKPLQVIKLKKHQFPAVLSNPYQEINPYGP
ncbi:hypothetical protein H4219_000082 [Mycoemilia scoparia]|uniref:Trafficking protein particle complex subunit 11 n=1 Tax=Mycoemilia scoparia TaxID=417184 RepID=A0A9W8A3X2_9FUNG|nr:hypothetical protein H4219_000082 [Mycoemilia scoparia]